MPNKLPLEPLLLYEDSIEHTYQPRRQLLLITGE